MGSALALFGALAAAPQALAAQPLHSALTAVSSDFPVTVTVSGVQPPVPAANGTLTISGTLTNNGSSPLKGVQAGLSLGHGKQPLGNRSTIATMLTRTDPTTADGKALNAPLGEKFDLAPGASRSFQLPPVAMNDLKLEGGGPSASANGAYELAVEALTTDTDGETTHVVGIGRSLLPYLPDAKDVQPTRIATLWPLTHAPELVAQTGSDADQTPVLRDDALATELGPDGRLGQLVTIGQSIPSLTWVIDPDLLDAVFAMTKPYRVQLPGRGGEPVRDDNTNTSAGQGQGVANDWLKKLRAAVAANGSSVVSLPYADPDLASIAHNGSGQAGLEAELGRARTAGKVTVEGRLSVDVNDTVAWPYQGYLDPQVAATAQKLGDTQVLVSSASLPESRNLNFTPSSGRPIGNGLTALVADSTISDLFQSDLGSKEAATAAEQRFLAETLTVTLENPSKQRTLVAMPPRSLSVAGAQVLQASLAAAQDGKWAQAVSLDAVAATPADPQAATKVSSAEAYPADLRATELSSSDFAGVAGMQQQVDLLLRILTVPQRVSGPFSAAIARSVSTAWREKPTNGALYRTNAAGYLQQLHDAVAIPAKSNKVTLAGDSGLLQVSVANDLQQPVINLELRLSSAQQNRLNVSKAESVVLGPGQSTSARFLAQAQGNGLVQMTAQLWTVGPDAQPYGPEVKFYVEVTQVPSGVWWVVGAGVLLVLLAGLRIYLQRKKRGDEPPHDPDAPLTEPDAPAAADLPEQEREGSHGRPLGPDGSDHHAPAGGGAPHP
ncbi:DUF6049 family protein [Kitasatospora nipponensis]|uniref:DUF6049 family protein n=1 Tax=Kitasatospora nipponensis TaxID=258049 RepID=A0ABN1WYC8_9ACTN